MTDAGDPKPPKKDLPAESEEDWLQAIDEWGSGLGDLLEDPGAPDPAAVTQPDVPKQQVFYRPEPRRDPKDDQDRTRVATITPEQRAMLRAPREAPVPERPTTSPGRPPSRPALPETREAAATPAASAVPARIASPPPRSEPARSLFPTVTPRPPEQTLLGVHHDAMPGYSEELTLRRDTLESPPEGDAGPLWPDPVDDGEDFPSVGFGLPPEPDAYTILDEDEFAEDDESTAIDSEILGSRGLEEVFVDGEEVLGASEQGLGLSRRNTRFDAPPERPQEYWQSRAQLLTGELPHATTDVAAARLLLELARIHEHRLSQPQLATAFYRRAREKAPDWLAPISGLVRIAQDAGRWDEVDELLDEALRLDLADHERVELLLLRAELSSSIHRDEARAAALLAEAANLAPSDPDVALAQSELAFARGDLDEVAARLLPFGGATGPTAAAVALLDGAARERASDPVAALSRYRAAADADPSLLGVLSAIERTALATGDRDAADDARRRMARALEGTPEGAAVQYRTARLAHLADGRAADAVATLSTLPPTRARRAATLAAAEVCQDVDAARTAATALAEGAEGTARAAPLLALGLLLRRAGQADEAAIVVAQAATEGPELGPAVWAEEEVLRANGHVQRAAERYAIYGEDAEAAAVFERAGMSADAIPLLERMGDDPAARALIEALEVDRGQWAKVCVRRAAQVARGGGASAMAARLQSLAASQAGRLSDPDGAIETLRRVRELTPDDPVTDTLPLISKGDDDAARADAAKLEASRVEDHARAADALVRQGWAREALGDADAAVRSFEEALARAPGHPFAAAALGRMRWWRQEGHAAATHHRVQAIHAGPEGAGELVLAARAAWDLDPAAAVADLQAAMALRGGDAEEALGRLAAWMAPPGSVRADVLEIAALAGDTIDAARVATLVQAAEAREDAGDPVRAVGLWRRAESLAPDDPSLAAALEDALEHAADYVALTDRFIAQVRSEEPWRRALGYERLADVDLRLRNDESAAASSLEPLSELRPTDLPTLRTMLRRALTQRDDEGASVLYGRIARALDGHVDAGPYCRRAAHLADRAKDAPPFGSLELAVGAAETARDVWALRYLEANARLDRDPDALAAVASRLAEAVETAAERAAYRTREAEANLDAGQTEAALAAFQVAVVASEGHLVALRGVAEAALTLAKHEVAAAALDAEAAASVVPAHIAEAAYRAGVLWQDVLQDDASALRSFGRVLDADATTHDAFARVMKIYDASGRHADAALACVKRIAAGGTPELLSSLWRTIADRRLTMGDRTGAKAAMREALVVRPADADALRRLAGELLEDEEWVDGIAQLVALGGVVTGADEIRRVFFQLGELYEERVNEPANAEQSYRRVLSVDPQHRPTLERLSRLLVRQSDWTAAREVTGQLLPLLSGAAERRPWRLVLSHIQEEGFKDLRGAEAQLEEARREAPTDLEALALIADFYRRHAAGPALSVLLDRAATDLRRALAAQPFDEASYRTLARVLEWRGKAEGTKAIAEILVMLGSPTPAEMALAAPGRAPLAAGADPELDESLAPPTLPPALRELLRLVHETLEKAVGAEPKTFGVGRQERLPSRGHATREAATSVARAFGLSDVEIYVSQRDAGTVVALPGSPPSVIIGRDLFGATDEAERLFLVARALKLVQSHLAVPLILPTSDFGLWLGAIVKQFDPGFTGEALDPGALEERTQRLTKILPRKLRDPLMPFALECEGAKALDPEAIATGAAELADRAALLVCGSVTAAVGALRKMGGDYLRLSSPAELVTRAGAAPAVRRILAFAISDAYFEARARAGRGLA